MQVTTATSNVPDFLCMIPMVAAQDSPQPEEREENGEEIEGEEEVEETGFSISHGDSVSHGDTAVPRS